MRGSARERGAWAEELACRFLLEQGLELVTRNYRSRHGELDLVMRDGTTTVFVEVRMRSGTDFGGALTSIDSHKCRRLVATAEHYLQHRGRASKSCRFDVVGITRHRHGCDIEWIDDAFRP